MKFIQKDLDNNQIYSYYNTSCVTENGKNSYNKVTVIYGFSILGSIIKLIQIPDILYKQLLTMQLIIGMYKSTKPILGIYIFSFIINEYFLYLFVYLLNYLYKIIF